MSTEWQNADFVRSYSSQPSMNRIKRGEPSSHESELPKKRTRRGSIPIESPNSDDVGDGLQNSAPDPKKQRGTKACLACRKVKMRCIIPEDGQTPCQRCRTQSYECVFEPSMRGKKRNQKAQAIEKSLKQMQDTLEYVMSNIASGSTVADPNLLAKAQEMLPFPINTNVPLQQQTLAQPSSAISPVIPSSLSSSLMLSPSCSMNLPTISSYLPPVTTDTSYASVRSNSLSTNATPGPRVTALANDDRLRSLPDNDLNPLGLLADASLKTTSNVQSPVGGLKLGVASAEFFKSTSPRQFPHRRLATEPDDTPAILATGLITQQEAIALFDIYFTRLTMFMAVLSPTFHSAQNLVHRSPFLFTCVCAVASKFYTRRPDLYSKCMSIAKEMAFSLVARAAKSIDIIQGFLVLAWYCQPVARFEQDSMYTLSGIAIRQGLELNIWRKSNAHPPLDATTEAKAQWQKERLNCERTWLYCFIVDHSSAIQTGRPYTLREDNLIRGSAEWHKQPYCEPSDKGLIVMVELAKVNGRFLDLIYTGRGDNPINNELDYKVILGMLDAEYEMWQKVFDFHGPSWSPYEFAMGAFYHFYYVSRVVFWSFGLQAALDKSGGGALDLASALHVCYSSAIMVIEICRDKMLPIDKLQTAPDQVFVMASYCAVFLLKLIHPRFGQLDARKILREVSSIIDVFEQIAVDDTHTPSLYASFLRILVRAKEEELLDEGTRPSTAQRLYMPNGLHQNPALDPTLAQDVNGDDPGVARFNVAALDAFSSGPGTQWSQNVLFPGFAEGLPYLASGQGSINGWSEFMLPSLPATPTSVYNSQVSLFGM